MKRGRNFVPRVETRMCATCGWEFEVDDTCRSARHCPACRTRRFGSRYSMWFKNYGRPMEMVAVEIRGTLSRPIPFELPRRPPRPEPAWLKGVAR